MNNSLEFHISELSGDIYQLHFPENINASFVDRLTALV